MSSRPIKNMAASVRERLLQQARKDKRPFDELLQYAAMDRFLYRWSKSKSANHFILKGALMLRVWDVSEQRATRDIDMLAKDTSNDLESITAIVQEVMAVDIEPDGFIFSTETVKAERITEDADYQGVRVKFTGRLDNAKISMQIDIGFGDIVYPAPTKNRLPAMLDFPPAEFITLKQVQWQAFRKKLDQEYIPESFEEVVTSINKFIMPVIDLDCARPVDCKMRIALREEIKK